MNSSKNTRIPRPARLLTALLALAFFAGSASVVQAQDISSMVITAQRPAHTDYSSAIREELREDTKIAVWLTRIDVGTDLGVKLGRPGKYRMAAIDKNNRG